VHIQPLEDLRGLQARTHGATDRLVVVVEVGNRANEEKSQEQRARLPMVQMILLEISTMMKLNTKAFRLLSMLLNYF
jgi:hypothetical protein